MLGEYKLGRCTRRCARLDRPLGPGEWYYSVVTESDEEGVLERIDISAQGWQGPPEGTLGWWKSRMPQGASRKWKLAPDPVLIELLKGSGPDAPNSRSIDDDLRFLIALLLLRRRVLQRVQPAKHVMLGSPSSADSSPLHDPPSANDSPATDAPTWLLEVVTDGTNIEVSPRNLSAAQSAAVEQRLIEMLYSETE